MAFKVSLIVAVGFSLFYSFATSENKSEDKRKTKIGKDVLDYTESDIYRLAEQWDVSSSFQIERMFIVYARVILLSKL